VHTQNVDIALPTGVGVGKTGQPSLVVEAISLGGGKRLDPERGYGSA